MKLSYAILTHNETESLAKLIDFLVKHKDDEDEIVILDDYSDNEKTKEILDTMCSIHEIKFEQRHLMNDFAEQKNYLKDMCSGDYIFNIDADEIPSKFLMNYGKTVIEMNPTAELFYLPRVNTVKGMTTHHVKKWNWQANDLGWINFPDWQGRIWKNRPNIRWEKPVHEMLTGFKEYSHFPPEEQYSLYHEKDIMKQEQQNTKYDEIIKKQ